MISTMRLRLSVLVALLATGGAVVGASTALLLARDDSRLGEQSAATASVSAVTLLVLLVLAGTLLVRRGVAPLTSMARASVEVTQGRHPDEAFATVALQGELALVADAVRTLALRLREIDASDRRFLMSISHELRTPLTAITGHAQAIEDFPDDADLRTQSLGVIRNEAARLERLVEDIVDLARLRSNKFTTVTESVQLEELGEHLLAVFSGASERDDQVSVTGAFEPVLLHSDGQRILQILRNLVGNALRYATTTVRVEGRREAGHVQLRVFNDGPPVPPSDAELIFEPFIGTKREGGMGLGLAIARELAWALGGNLRLLPRSDGAEFELVLPLEPSSFGR